MWLCVFNQPEGINNPPVDRPCSERSRSPPVGDNQHARHLSPQHWEGPFTPVRATCHLSNPGQEDPAPQHSNEMEEKAARELPGGGCLCSGPSTWWKEARHVAHSWFCATFPETEARRILHLPGSSHRNVSECP